MKRLLLLSLFVGIGSSVAAQALSKLAVKALTKKKSDLSEISATVGYYQNLYPAETGTLTVKYMKKSWKAGAAFVGITLLNKSGVGIVSLEGEVRIDGVVVPETTPGSYLLMVDASDAKPRTVSIKSAKGQEASFTVKPMPIPAIKSINGKTTDFEIDLSKDVELELNLSEEARKYPIALAMLVKIPMGKDFSNFLLAKANNRYTIPKEALRSKQISGGFRSKSVIKFEGKNYFRVESFDEQVVRGTAFGAARIVNGAYATVPVKVLGKDESHNVIYTTGKSEKKQGKFEFWTEKPNSFYAPDLGHLKKVGLASLSVSGVLFKQTTSTSSSTNYYTGTITTTTTITTYEFPALPDATWNNLIETLYSDLEKTLKTHGVSLEGPDRIVKHPAYQEFFSDPDTLTKVLVQKNYKGTKRLSPTSLSEIVGSATSTYTIDYPHYKIMNDLKLDGLVVVSLDLRVGDDGKKHVVLHPVLTYQVFHKPPYPAYGMITPAIRGTITGEGISFSKKELNDPNCLKRIAQTEHLNIMLKKSIDSAEEEAKTLKYSEIWSLL